MRPGSYPKLILGLLMIVILVATGLRLWRLPGLPPGLWLDEAYNAMDALWMLETRSPQVFFVANYGREPMFHYLAAVSLFILGASPYALRLVSALVGIVTIPLGYRWVATMFSNGAERRWLGLVAAAGLGLSFWHTAISRTGFRTILLPPFVILTSYLFWRGWQSRSLRYFVAAGIALGLSQYTYLSARLLPLVYAFFALSWTLLAKRQSGYLYQRQVLWRGLLAMAVASGVVFAPLGLYFLQNPSAMFTRIGDVSILTQSSQDLTGHLFDAIGVFIGGSDPEWRHNLVGRPVFDWLSLFGFGIGLLVVIRHLRRPAYLFLLLSLLVLWLPAMLSTPAIHLLRLSGLLPIYYTLMAVGLMSLARWTMRRASALGAAGRQPALRWGVSAALALTLAISGGLTTYDYFVRWANQPQVYDQFEGPLADLARQVMVESQASDVLLPFNVYVHPTTRLLLHDAFRETDRLPAGNPSRPAILVTLPDTVSPGYVWLTRDAAGRGRIYVPPPLQPAELEALSQGQPRTPLLNPYTNTAVAHFTPLRNVATLFPALTRQTLSPADYDWGQRMRLAGYQIQPDQVQPGQSLTVNLYWQEFTEQPIAYQTFVQLISPAGRPLTEANGHIFLEEFLWRAGAIPDQYLLWIGPEVPPGPYLVRIGLFNPNTGQRLPVYDPAGKTLGDQLILGLFYVAAPEANPRLPQTPLPARLGDHIRLLGYSRLPSPDDNPALRIQLYWQPDSRPERDYTTFLQLLDAQSQLVTGWDAQPLGGQYPTSRWQPGEIVVDELTLPLPEQLAPGQYRLVTGMYDLATGQRLPAASIHGQPWPGDMIVLLQTYLAR